jgi:hypothetical protein
MDEVSGGIQASPGLRYIDTADDQEQQHAQANLCVLSIHGARQYHCRHGGRFDAGLEGGVNFQLASNADLRLPIGANYVDARKTTTQAFAPLGVDAVQMTEQRWSVPIDLGVNYRF